VRPVLAIAGPTGAGKTAAAIAVAEAYGAVVVSADAMQVYRGLDIGTNKATTEEQRRAPHFAIDVRDPDEAFDAADFVAIADEVRARHERVVLCGGTSLYLRSFTRGLVAVPDVDRALRTELEALADPHGELARVDPALAARLHPHDTKRIVRGLEVFRASGRRLSELQDAHGQEPDRVPTVGLWLDVPDLDERLDARVLSMIDRGYVAEVEGLLARGYARTLKPMQSLGYRHLCDHLLDALPLDEAIRRTQRDTRRFARKQRTWMRGLGYRPTTSVDEVLRAANEVLDTSTAEG
jgi:tRNA dimethylallyltransferase